MHSEDGEFGDATLLHLMNQQGADFIRPGADFVPIYSSFDPSKTRPFGIACHARGKQY